MWDEILYFDHELVQYRQYNSDMSTSSMACTHYVVSIIYAPH